MSIEESCLVIAGEKSGEDHAMTFLPDLMKLQPNCKFYGVGGSRLEEQGVELLYHLKDFSGIGISEVLGKIPFYFRALDHIVNEVIRRKTKTVILIDFQGFNLKLAKKLKKLNVKVLYYVAPQAWVWKEYRVKTLEKCVHTLFTILPFEKEWFEKRGVTRVKSVFHPLTIEYKEEIPKIRKRAHTQMMSEKPKILLLPGSRNVEVGTLLPIFKGGLDILKEQGYDFELGIVKSESVKEEHYDSRIDISKTWDSKDLANALDWADMSVAASGTVTLATGLFGVPTVVCYQVSLFTEFVLGLFLKYDGPISLTNIIHKKLVYPELIQYQADRYNVAVNLKYWLENKEAYDQVVNTLKETAPLLEGEHFSVPEYMSDVISGGL